MTISKQYANKIWLALVATLLLRLLAMWAIPLTDTTEARYGEIARKMVETNNWVTPLNNYDLSADQCAATACVNLGAHSYGMPFWAKPPLSTWAAAASMKMFGVNEFASRLPSLLFCLGLLALLYYWLKPRANNLNFIALALLSTSLLFIGSAGLVMTDLALIFSSMLAMISFWQRSVEKKHIFWGYVFFISLGIGLLAKGPLILVLVGLPTGLWTLLHRQLINVWKRLPWISGLILTLIIAGPWYWLAEQSTPGFLQYFIIGEHFSRFLISGWGGDLYGHAHSEPLGMIWLYLVAGFFPWCLVIIPRLIKFRKQIHWRYPIGDLWLSYLILWSVMPVIFFTFAHNIISPYALPAMPACAILFAEFFVRVNSKDENSNERSFFRMVLIMPIIFVVIAIVYSVAPQVLSKRSEKALVQQYLDLRPSSESQLIYMHERLYSAEFYSAGKAHVMHSTENLATLLNNSTEDFVAVDKRYMDDSLRELLSANFKKLVTYHDITLYQECMKTGCPP